MQKFIIFLEKLTTDDNKSLIEAIKNGFTIIHESIDYPNGFDINKLKTIKSFIGKQRYVREHLEYIGAGSSRVVFKIDDTHVLKLAKNPKGIAQNMVEGDFSMHQWYPTFVPELVEVDDDYIWIIKERVNKITKKEFEKISGYKFNEFSQMLKKLINDRTTSRKQNLYGISEDKFEEFIDDEFIVDLCDFIINFNMEVADMTQLSNWGKSLQHEDNPVLTDVGLTKTVWKDHYNR